MNISKRSILTGLLLFAIGIIIGSVGGVTRLWGGNSGGSGLSEEALAAVAKELKQEGTINAAAVFISKVRMAGDEDDSAVPPNRDEASTKTLAGEQPNRGLGSSSDGKGAGRNDKGEAEEAGESRENTKKKADKDVLRSPSRDPNEYPFEPPFDPSSPIYVSQNVNVSYHAGRVVIPFQFRKDYARRAEGLNGELDGNLARLTKKIPVEPHLHIHEGRETAKQFIELWRTFGRGADFPKIPYSKFGSPFWIENVRKKLRIHLPEVKVRPLLGQIIHREAQNKKLISEAKSSGAPVPDLQSPILPEGHRRLMLDVGARQFSGSPLWLGKHYPEAKTFDFVAFELLDLEKDYGPATNYFKSFQYIRKAGWTHDRGVRIEGVRMAKVVDSGSSAGTEGNGRDGGQKNVGEAAQQGSDDSGRDGDAKGSSIPPTRAGVTYWNAPSVDLASFIKNNSRPDDFVVMKLDIEGGEWQLIQHLVNEGVIPYYIDELMMECHAKDPHTYAILGFKLLPPECMDLIADLREMGVYAHRWV